MAEDRGLSRSFLTWLISGDTIRFSSQENFLAKIELHDVSLTYPAPPDVPAPRLFEMRKERIQEDLPADKTSDIRALDHVNLTIPNGRTFVVVGPSGCGKSTLLRVVSGLANDHAGQVLYDGEDVRNILPKDRHIGMVFQGYALYPNFNNEGNLSFFFHMHRSVMRKRASASAIPPS